MKRRHAAAALVAAVPLLLSILAARAGAVPYLPTPPEVVHAMLEMARAGPDDVVMDLGSGDGRIVIAAARDFGARAIGIEQDERLVEWSRNEAARVGVAQRATFRRGDLYTTDLRDASVLTLYLLPSVNLGLRMRIVEQMAPGSRVVSHAYDMGDWRPDAKREIRASKVFLWIVPAPVEGTWRITVGGTETNAHLELEQHFQQVSARLVAADGTTSLVPATLSGTALTLELPPSIDGIPAGTLRGRVLGDLVSGTLDGRFTTLARTGPLVRRTAGVAAGSSAEDRREGRREDRG